MSAHQQNRPLAESTAGTTVWWDYIMAMAHLIVFGAVPTPLAGGDDQAVLDGLTLARTGEFRDFYGEEFDNALTNAALRKGEPIGRPIGWGAWLAAMAERTGKVLLPV